MQFLGQVVKYCNVSDSIRSGEDMLTCSNAEVYQSATVITTLMMISCSRASIVLPNPSFSITIEFLSVSLLLMFSVWMMSPDSCSVVVFMQCCAQYP